MGDGESMEGNVWEALNFAGFYKLDNLVAIIDVNRLGTNAGGDSWRRIRLASTCATDASYQRGAESTAGEHGGA